MSDPFLGQIKLVGFNFAPRGWALCDGQILPINTNQALFSLLGTNFGGDGRTTFGLPDLRGRAPVHEDGSSYRLGAKSGAERHYLQTSEIPSHTHDAALHGTAARATSGDPDGKYLAEAEDPAKIYDSAQRNQLAVGAVPVNTSGSGQGHDNMQPYLAVNYIIAMMGIFPSRN